ncbi:DExH-box ATP-dependent RNA helicase DExH15 chloroplastic, partial [Mucuna pruriens]
MRLYRLNTQFDCACPSLLIHIISLISSWVRNQGMQFITPAFPSIFFRFKPGTATTLPFSLLRHRSLPLPLKFRTSFSFKTPTSTFRAFFDAKEDEEEEDDEEEKDEEEDEDDDDDIVAADEYDDVPGDVSDEDAHVFSRHDGFKCEVREFVVEIIDVDELASVYDFRIDKFQRQVILAFLRGSSVVVFAPMSSGKTLMCGSYGGGHGGSGTADFLHDVAQGVVQSEGFSASKPNQSKANQIRRKNK